MNNLSDASYALVSWQGDKLPAAQNQWYPGFDAERCLVYSKLGFYRKLFERPRDFTKRFYHVLQPLAIEHWQLFEQISLYDDFCTIAVRLDLRFQATLAYVQKNDLVLADVNANIKTVYEPLIQAAVQEVLLRLDDGAWVQSGLLAQEREIAQAINELLLGQEIQSQALCQLEPSFKNFPDIKFKEQGVYLMALKKNFEAINQKQQEQFLLEQQAASQRIAEQQQRLELQERSNALELQTQALQAMHDKHLLLEEAAQQAERLAIEKRMHAEQVKHATALHELSLVESMKQQEKQESLQRLQELRTLDEKARHQLALKEHELTVKVKAYELEKNQWRKVKEQWREEDARQKQRQKQADIDAEMANKVYLYQQQLKLQAQLEQIARKAPR